MNQSAWSCGGGVGPEMIWNLNFSYGSPESEVPSIVNMNNSIR